MKAKASCHAIEVLAAHLLMQPEDEDTTEHHWTIYERLVKAFPECMHVNYSYPEFGVSEKIEIDWQVEGVTKYKVPANH